MREFKKKLQLPVGSASVVNLCKILRVEKMMRKFLKDESGATAIEYGLIAAAMATCLLLAEPFLVNSITGKFTDIGAKLTAQ